MKTSIELSDLLLDQAKAAARAQGVTRKALIESGSRMAIHLKSPALNRVTWLDLTFHAQAAEAGYLAEPGQWRDAANSTSWPSKE